jgi:hypothetical protein
LFKPIDIDASQKILNVFVLCVVVEGHEIMKKNMSTNGVCVQDSDEYGEYEIMNGIEKDKGTTTRGTRGTDDDSWSLVVSRKTTRNLSKIRTGNRKTKINN